jgi:CheY-like chemotaxis protein
MPANVNETPAETDPDAEPDTDEGSVTTLSRAPDVLVIDDDEHARDLIRRALEAEKYSVVTARSGDEGLELARALRPSLVTLDILMPGTDGWSVLSQLKSDPATRSIPVVMLSITADRRMGYVLGAVESLTKPVDRGVLREVVERYVTSDAFHILVVEDDEHSRSLLTRYLDSEGWDHSEAKNGIEALDRAQTRRPDLVLLDLMMPEMDGFEFLETMRQWPDYRSIPVVVVTAKTLTQADRARLDGNVARVIEKGTQTVEELVEYLRETRAQRDTQEEI